MQEEEGKKTYQRVFDMAELMQFTDCSTRLQPDVCIHFNSFVDESDSEQPQRRRKILFILYRFSRCLLLLWSPRYILNKNTKPIWWCASKLNLQFACWSSAFVCLICPWISFLFHELVNLICGGKKVFGIISDVSSVDPIRLFHFWEALFFPAWWFRVWSCIGVVNIISTIRAIIFESIYQSRGKHCGKCSAVENLFSWQLFAIILAEYPTRCNRFVGSCDCCQRNLMRISRKNTFWLQRKSGKWNSFVRSRLFLPATTAMQHDRKKIANKARMIRGNRHFISIRATTGSAGS